jgi:hypothetical protein
MKGHPKDVQESIMSDIHYLHSSYSENEFQVRLTEAITKWHNEEPGFAEYFLASIVGRYFAVQLKWLLPTMLLNHSTKLSRRILP